MVEGGEDYEPDEGYDPEAEVVDWGAEKKLNLPEVPIVTGEEDEDIAAKFRSKLYRWANNEWKERGVGDLKFLKNKKNGKIRVVLRQDKTHKVVANFYVSGSNMCQLTRMKSSDKAWIWTCYDCSDQAPVVQKLCAKFVSKEDFEAFQKEFESSYKENLKHVQQSKPEEKKEKPEEKKEGASAEATVVEKKE
jgi:Ran-binding protein 1